MGYDPASLDFVYRLMNADGDVTVNIDSSGNLTVERGAFKGSITIGTDTNVFKADGATGIWLGHADFASAPFKVGIDGAATATNLTVVGGIISGSTISGGKFENASGTGWMEIDQADGTNIADFKFWVDTIVSDPLFEIYNDISAVALKAFGIAFLATSGDNTSPIGTWNCSSAEFTGLTNGTSDYTTKSWVDSQGYITGTSGFTGSKVIDGETWTFEDGILKSIA